MQAGFLDEIARLLEPQGELFVQTDVDERAAGYEELAALDDRFVPDGDAPGSPRLTENPYAARSSRERRAIADGLPIHRLRWKRRRGEPPSREAARRGESTEKELGSRGREAPEAD